ncbi:MAG: hypothetical protein WAO58_07460 [Fimbriimonadaceae bacterium]
MATVGRIEQKWWADVYQVIEHGGKALVLIRWGWDKGTHFEHLLSVTASPKLAVRAVRPLNPMDGSFWAPGADRVYMVGRRALLYAKTKMLEIDSLGRTRRTAFKLPPLTGPPKGRVRGNWIVLGGEGYSAAAIYVVNLVTGESKRLLGRPGEQYSSWGIYRIDPRGFLLLSAHSMDGKTLGWYKLLVPSGKLISIPKPLT